MGEDRVPCSRRDWHAYSLTSERGHQEVIRKQLRGEYLLRSRALFAGHGNRSNWWPARRFDHFKSKYISNADTRTAGDFLTAYIRRSFFFPLLSRRLQDSVERPSFQTCHRFRRRMCEVCPVTHLWAIISKPRAQIASTILARSFKSATLSFCCRKIEAC